MAKHIHFVDVNDPEISTKGQPYKSKIFEGDFYRIELSYPADHRVKLPLQQMVSLSILNKTKNNIAFTLHQWVLQDVNGKSYVPVIEHKFKEIEVSQILNKLEALSRDSKKVLYAFYDIPPSVKRITIDLEIEITSPEGKKILIQESIPLKQATFTTSFFEGWGW